jgi:hypothetical protein
MTEFGDYDPDDTWDASDPVAEQLRILARRILWLVDHRDDMTARVQRIIDDIEQLRIRLARG